MAYIEINDVSKVYQRVGEPFHALSHVSLEIERGEFICLLGPSGCGKTTLLNTLAGFEHVRPAQLSGGMQQRVSIARGLAVQPDVLFMDEPFAALDAITRLKMQDDIHRIAEEEGVTVVFVTHDIEEAVALADRIVVLTPNPGRVREIIKVELGPDRLRTADDFLAVRDHVFDVFGMKPNWNVEYVI